MAQSIKNRIIYEEDGVHFKEIDENGQIVGYGHDINVPQWMLDIIKAKLDFVLGKPGVVNPDQK